MSNKLATVTIDLSTPDRQDIHTIPAGPDHIILGFVLHSPAGAYEPVNGSIQFASNRNDGYGGVQFDFEEEDDYALLSVPIEEKLKRLRGGDTIQAQFTQAFSGIASIQVDIFGYPLGE